MVCEAMGCETPVILHPHSSHCEQDLPQREVGFLRSVNEDTDTTHGCYTLKKHITYCHHANHTTKFTVHQSCKQTCTMLATIPFCYHLTGHVQAEIK